MIISWTLNYFASKFGISNPKVSPPFGSLEMVATNLNVPTFYTFLINLNGHEKLNLKRPFALSVYMPLITNLYRLNKRQVRQIYTNY